MDAKKDNAKTLLFELINISKLGIFNPVGMHILVDICFSFNMNIDYFINILCGGHCVVQDDHGAFWNRWYNLLKKNEAYLQGRWSSHPSVVTKEYKHDNMTKPHQYEINLGEIDGHVFCILFGKYGNIKQDTSYKDPKKDFRNDIAHKVSKYTLGITNKFRKYEPSKTSLVDDSNVHTWFQLEKTAVHFEPSDNKITSKIGKVKGTLKHALDFLQYKYYGKNIGPFGKSAYTEDPWKPLFLTCCQQPKLCYRRRQKVNRFMKRTVPVIGYQACHSKGSSMLSLMKEKREQTTKCSILKFLFDEYYFIPHYMKANMLKYTISCKKIIIRQKENTTNLNYKRRSWMRSITSRVNN